MTREAVASGKDKIPPYRGPWTLPKIILVALLVTILCAFVASPVRQHRLRASPAPLPPSVQNRNVHGNAEKGPAGIVFGGGDDDEASEDQSSLSTSSEGGHEKKKKKTTKTHRKKLRKHASTDDQDEEGEEKVPNHGGDEEEEAPSKRRRKHGGASLNGLSTCSKNPALKQYTEAALGKVEEAYQKWRRDLVPDVSDMIDEMKEQKPKRPTKKFSEYQPSYKNVFGLFSPLSKCPNGLKRWGANGDGGKMLCGFEDAGETDNCIVYSLGGNNQWDFEKAIVRKTNCEVYTFDCTVKKPNIKLPDRIHFSKTCLGGQDQTLGGKEFRTLATLMSDRGHDHIDLLKMDIEGWEHEVFQSMMFPAPGQETILPFQISFELHLLTWEKQATWFNRRRNVGEEALMLMQLYEGGYRSVSREDNPDCPHCTEITLLRHKC